MSTPRSIFVALALVIVVLAPIAYAVGGERPGRHADLSKVDPRLLLDETYGAGLLERYLEFEQAPPYLFDAIKLREGQVRALLLVAKGNDFERVVEATSGVVSGFDFGNYVLLSAWVTKDDVMELAKHPSVVRIVYDEPLLTQLRREASLLEHSEGGGLPGAQPTTYKAVEVLGATDAWELGVNGSGVSIAVIDTGVDFGSSDLGLEAIARDAEGRPLVIDADAIGLVLTPIEAYVNETGYISIELPEEGLPVYLFGFITFRETGFVFLCLRDYGCANVEFPLEEFYVGDIRSKDGRFKFGLAAQLVLLPPRGFIVYTAPSVLADTDGDGSYDTAVIDLSTTWYYIQTAFSILGVMEEPDEALRDFSFADEPLLSYGNEIAARDFNGDGVNDFSMGSLAGWVYDIWGVIEAAPFIGTLDWLNAWEFVGTLHPGLDPDGNYFDLLYDFHSHGTSCAHVAASRGLVPRPLGYGEVFYRLKGIAPGAKLGAAPALWWGDVITAELFLSGFDLKDQPWVWEFTGRHRVDVISNSWGASWLVLIGAGNDADPLTLFENYISAVSGTLIVHAIGNGGPGWGTVTMPGSAANVLSVGASTLFAYRPYFGYLPGAWNEVVSWSDRGPTMFGYPKPDVVNIGSFEWAGTYVWRGLGDGVYAFGIFGGTSEATPMTAGIAALVIDAYYRKHGVKPSPDYVKVVIKNSAVDLGYDAFSQGSGHANALRAVSLVLNDEPLIYTYDAQRNIASQVLRTYAALGITPPATMDVAVYVPPLAPGEATAYTLVVEGSGTLELEPVKHTLTETLTNLAPFVDLGSAVLVAGGQVVPATGLVTVYEEGILVNFSAIPPGGRLYVPLDEALFEGADLVEMALIIPYEFFDPTGRLGRYVPALFVGVELSYWLDVNLDGLPFANETARVQYDIRMSNTFHLQLGRPLEKFELTRREAVSYLARYAGIDASAAPGKPVLDIRVFWNGYYLAEAPPVPIKVLVKKYKLTGWEWIEAPELVGFEGVTPVTLTVRVPSDASPGIYEGYVKATINGRTVLVPVSVSVAARIPEDALLVRLGGAPQAEHPYDNYAVRGANDWTWRYESGDWRSIPVIVDDPDVLGLVVMVRWSDYDSSFDVSVVGPGYNRFEAMYPENVALIDGAVVGAKMTFPVYVFGSGHIGHYDSPLVRFAKTFAEIPPAIALERPAVYWVVLKNTLLGGDLYPEPYTLYIMPQRAPAIAVTVGTTDEESVTERLTAPGFGRALVMTPMLLLELLTGSVVTPEEVGVEFVAEPGELGMRARKQFELLVRTSEAKPGVYLGLMAVVSEHVAQYDVGLQFMGIKVPLVVTPGVLWVPVLVTVVPG